MLLSKTDCLRTREGRKTGEGGRKVTSVLFESLTHNTMHNRVLAEQDDLPRGRDQDLAVVLVRLGLGELSDRDSLELARPNNGPVVVVGGGGGGGGKGRPIDGRTRSDGAGREERSLEVVD